MPETLDFNKFKARKEVEGLEREGKEETDLKVMGRLEEREAEIVSADLTLKNITTADLFELIDYLKELREEKGVDFKVGLKENLENLRIVRKENPQSGFAPIQIILSILAGTIILGGIVGGVLYFSKQEVQQQSRQIQQGKCGEGVCDSAEKANSNLCPKDCEQEKTEGVTNEQQSTTQTATTSQKPPSSTTTPAPPSSKESYKDSPFGIFGSYVTLTAENPLKSVSKSEVATILKDVGVKWSQEMPVGDNISEIAKSGANIYSRIGCMGKTPPYTSDQKCKDSIISIIKQYKNTIKYWEFATEPNGGTPPMGWKGYGKEYATDLKEAYAVIKKECPDCFVVFGGLTGTGVGATEVPGGAADFLKEALAGGAGNYFDVFEFKQHAANADDYKEIVVKLNIYAKIFSDNRLDIKKKPIFIETATHDGSPSPGANRPGLKSQTQTQQAIGLLKYYVYSLGHGIDKIFWNLVYERHNFGSTGATLPGMNAAPAGSSVFDYYGLVNNPDNDGDSSKKLSYYTYKKMVEVLDGSDWNNIQTIQEKDGVYIYKFIKAGNPIWVAWNDNSASKQVIISSITTSSVKVTETVPKYESGKEVTNYSTAFTIETKTVSGGEITITLKDKPVFVE